jgi:hypothetical protein
MQMENWEFIARALSQDLLSAYFSESKNSTLDDRLAIYLWNNTLSESLYHPLHFFEVTLRNALNREIHAHTKKINWLEDKLFLRDVENNIIEDVLKNKIRKINPYNLTGIISKLPFGFWVNLFHNHYEGKLWPSLLKSVFPNIPRKKRVRQIVYKKFNGIRELRNRVFHHEPIWQLPNLLQLHDGILEAIGWMSPPVGNLTAYITQFPRIYTEGYRHYWEKTIQTHFLVSSQIRETHLVSIT